MTASMRLSERQKDIIGSAIVGLLIMLGVILVTSGCCPKITSSTQIEVKRDTVTVFESDTVVIQEKAESFEIDFGAICDSLSKNKPFTQALKQNKTGLTLYVDAGGHGTVICKEDSLNLIIDSLRTFQVITVDTTTHTNTVVHQCDSDFHSFTKWFFWVVLLLLAVISYIKLKPF